VEDNGWKNSEQSASTGVWAATSPQLAGRGGLNLQEVKVVPVGDDSDSSTPNSPTQLGRTHDEDTHPRDAAVNRGTAFTADERASLGLVGRLPSAVEMLDQQATRTHTQLQKQPLDSSKYIYLDQSHERNEVLYYRFRADRLSELLPIVSDPTIGDAIEAAFATLGLPHDDVDLIVASDAEQILGIGDWRVSGTDIAIGKLAITRPRPESTRVE